MGFFKKLFGAAERKTSGGIPVADLFAGNNFSNLIENVNRSFEGFQKERGGCKVEADIAALADTFSDLKGRRIRLISMRSLAIDRMHDLLLDVINRAGAVVSQDIMDEVEIGIFFRESRDSLQPEKFYYRLDVRPGTPTETSISGELPISDFPHTILEQTRQCLAGFASNSSTSIQSPNSADGINHQHLDHNDRRDVIKHLAAESSHFRHKGQWHDAARCYQQLLSLGLQPEDEAKTLANLMQMLENEGKINEAISAGQQALLLVQEHRLAWTDEGAHLRGYLTGSLNRLIG